MRGSPLLRALLAFLTILALGYPLRRVTGAADDGNSAAKPAAAPTDSQPLAAITLQLTFTTAPASFVVRHLGHDVWNGGGAKSESQTLRLPYPPQGIELHLDAAFPADAPLSAARLVLTDPAGDRHEKSCWGTGRIDEVLTFP
jgi:hypothetical protein